MARPVKDTPILRGKDAEAFARAVKDNENSKVPNQDYDRALATFARVNESSKSQ